MLFTCGSLAARSAPIAVRRERGPRRHFTVDIHCHVETPEAAALIKTSDRPPIENAMTFSNEATREVNRKQQQTIYLDLTSVEKRLKHMDRNGIDIQAISTAPGQYYYWAEPELARQTSRLINENIAQICHDHPDRFVGLATVPLQEPELAVRELERAVKELGMRGVEICTNVAGAELSEERFRPFFAKAEELDILIFMHPSGFTEGRRLSDHYFINVIGNPLDSTVAVHHLIFDGVLERYPRLKIVVAHGGGYLPAYSGRIDHGHRARPDAAASSPSARRAICGSSISTPSSSPITSSNTWRACGAATTSCSAPITPTTWRSPTPCPSSRAPISPAPTRPRSSAATPPASSSSSAPPPPRRRHARRRRPRRKSGNAEIRVSGIALVGHPWARPAGLGVAEPSRAMRKDGHLLRE